MNDKFFFIGFDNQEISQKKFICIYILNHSKKIVHKVFKLYNDKLQNTLTQIKPFTEFNEFISFNIKRDGKIALDIKNL